MRSPSLFQSSGLTAFARPKAADLNKISLSAKEKEAGHYSGLNENWRSETFDAGRSLSFAHVQLHFGVQQRCQNNTILALGLSPIVVTSGKIWKMPGLSRVRRFAPPPPFLTGNKSCLWWWSA
jgi:hypothetical protein